MKRLLGLKVVLIPIILFIFIISLIFSLRGIWLCIDVIFGLISGSRQFVHFSDLGTSEAPSLMLLEAVDLFLVSFVFFIFSFGLYKIFFVPETDEPKSKLPGWLQINSIFELKALLWQSVLTTLVIVFLNKAIIMISLDKMDWHFLFLPLSILIIAVALYFLKLSEKTEKAD
jgi:uncharacterized membrane protein YqhA